MLGIQRGWQGQFDHAALDQRFQFAGCLLMILDHLLRERLGVRVRLLGERDVARLTLEHITDRDLVHEVLSRWCMGKSNGGEQSAADCEDQSTFHGGTPVYDGLSAVQPTNLSRLFWFPVDGSPHR